MSHIKTAVIILIIAVTLSVIMTYAGILTIIGIAKENTKLAMSSFITYNSIEIYDSLKNGNDYTADLNKIFFKNEILSVFCMDFSNSFLYYTNEKGENIYKMTLPDVTFELDNTLKFKSTYTVIVPIVFAGQQIYELEIPQMVTAYYNIK